jgi:ribonuclease J
LVIVATIDGKTGELVGSPDIISRGFVYMKNNRLIEETRHKIKQILKGQSKQQLTDDMYIKDKIRNDIGQFLFTKIERRPMILPLLIQV